MGNQAILIYITSGAVKALDDRLKLGYGKSYTGDFVKKKSKKPAKKKYSGPTLIDRLPKDQGEWLELAIKFTLRGINSPPVTGLDRDMLAQAERLRNELYIWRERERQNKTPAS